VPTAKAAADTPSASASSVPPTVATGVTLILANYPRLAADPELGDKAGGTSGTSPLEVFVDRLVGPMQAAISKDPVLPRLVEMYPWLAQAHAGIVRSVGRDKPAFTYETLRALLTTKRARQEWEDFSLRVCGIAASALPHCAHDEPGWEALQAFLEWVQSAGSTDRVVAACQDTVEAFFGQAHVELIQGCMHTLVREAFLPAQLEDTQLYLTKIVGDHMGTAGPYPWASILQRELRRTPPDGETPYLPATEAIALWLRDVVIPPEMVESRRECVDRTVRSGLKFLNRSPDLHNPMMILSVGIAWVGMVVRNCCLAGRSSDTLTTREAAAYLGIRPSTFHTHVQKYADTERAIPVRLDTSGHGRGLFLVDLSEFIEWSKKHYRPRLKRRRG
jgi:hypothetical protein